MKTVTIYSTPTCHFCHLAKDYFTEHGIEYVDYNVAEDMDKRKEMVDITGQMGVPVIIINEEGKDPVGMVGFNQQLIADTFGIKE